MKVINPGFTREWSDEALCTGSGNGLEGCQARLLVEPHDLFRLQEGCTTATFECPECSAHTNIPEYPEHLVRILPTMAEYKERLRG